MSLLIALAVWLYVCGWFASLAVAANDKPPETRKESAKLALVCLIWPVLVTVVVFRAKRAPAQKHELPRSRPDITDFPWTN